MRVVEDLENWIQRQEFLCVLWTNTLRCMTIHEAASLCQKEILLKCLCLEYGVYK